MAKRETKRGPKVADRPAKTPLPGPPTAPDYLDDPAKEHWVETVGLLKTSGLLSRVDRAALVQYCSLWSKWLDAEKQVKETGGAVITAPNGYKQANPWYTIASNLQKDLKPYLDMLGLTPKSRSKLKVPEPETPNAKWEDFEA